MNKIVKRILLAFGVFVFCFLTFEIDSLAKENVTLGGDFIKVGDVIYYTNDNYRSEDVEYRLAMYNTKTKKYSGISKNGALLLYNNGNIYFTRDGKGGYDCNVYRYNIKSKKTIKIFDAKAVFRKKVNNVTGTIVDNNKRMLYLSYNDFGEVESAKPYYAAVSLAGKNPKKIKKSSFYNKAVEPNYFKRLNPVNGDTVYCEQDVKLTYSINKKESTPMYVKRGYTYYVKNNSLYKKKGTNVKKIFTARSSQMGYVAAVFARGYIVCFVDKNYTSKYYYINASGTKAKVILKYSN